MLRAVALSLSLASVVVATDPAKNDSPTKKGGASASPEGQLWAAISGSQPMLDLDEFTVDPFVLRFALVNDSNKTLNPELGSAKVFVNGKELKQTPTGILIEIDDKRSEALPPGDHLAFGRNIGKNFDKPGIYRLVWKGKGFESPEIVFRVVSAKKR